MSELVEDLELWLDQPAYVDTTARGRELDRASWLIGRARDEIVALRKLTDGDWVWQQITSTRDAALEDAAAACLRKARDHVIPIGQDNFHDGCISCAAAIRELKGKGDG